MISRPIPRIRGSDTPRERPSDGTASIDSSTGTEREVFNAFKEFAILAPVFFVAFCIALTAGVSPRFWVVFLAALAKLFVTGLRTLPIFVKLVFRAVLTDLTALLAATATFLAVLLTALNAFGRIPDEPLFRALKPSILGWLMDNAFVDIVPSNEDW